MNKQTENKIQEDSTEMLKEDTQQSEEVVVRRTKDENIDLSKYGKRTPIHKQKRVGIKAKKGWSYRLVNDSPGRIQQFLEAGWEIEQDDSVLDTDERMQLSKGQTGKQASAIVNYADNAKTKVAYWMKIPTEIFEQDQREKDRLVDAQEDKIKPKALREDGNIFMGADLTNKY